MKKKIIENYVAIYKKGQKELALKKMENLVTRMPNKILMAWEEILEDFEKNKDSFELMATPGTDAFDCMVEDGFNEDILDGFIKDGEIVNKEMLVLVIGFLKYNSLDYDTSCDEDFNIVDYSLDENGEFRIFKEVKSLSAKEFISAKELTKYKSVGAIGQKGNRMTEIDNGSLCSLEFFDFSADDSKEELYSNVSKNIEKFLHGKEDQYDVTIFEVEIPQDFLEL